jgi:hypothetical protein
MPPQFFSPWVSLLAEDGDSSLGCFAVRWGPWFRGWMRAASSSIRTERLNFFGARPQGIPESFSCHDQSVAELSRPCCPILITRWQFIDRLEEVACWEDVVSWISAAQRGALDVLKVPVHFTAARDHRFTCSANLALTYCFFSLTARTAATNSLAASDLTT